jgi:large-conductance mechanosensitive channel
MDLGRFLKQRDIIYTMCAISITTQLILVAEIITNSFILPVINRNTVDDNKIENFVVQLKGAKIELGKLLAIIIRMIVIASILYLIYYLTY